MYDVDIILGWLESELSYHKKKGTISLHLCNCNGLIRTAQADHSPVHHPILYRFTEKQLESGFTGTEWAKLTRILLSAMKGTPLCKRT